MMVSVIRLERRIEKLKASKQITDANKELIVQFINAKSNTTRSTRWAYVGRLTRLALFFKNKDIKSMSCHDFNEYLTYLDGHFSKKTYNSDLILYKQFFRWLDMPDVVK